MNEELPKGKRSIRTTVRGSIVGYIGRTPWMNFGERSDPHATTRANAWIKEADGDDALTFFS